MKRPLVWCGFCLLLLVSIGNSAEPAKPALPDSLNFDQIRRLPVQFYDRNMPLDTMARMIVWKVTGTEHFDGRDPVQVLLSWHFEPEMWRSQAIIPVGDKKFREALGLNPEDKEFSPETLFQNPSVTKIVSELKDKEEVEETLNPLEKNVQKLRDRVVYLQQTFMGRTIAFANKPGDGNAPWLAISELRVSSKEDLHPLVVEWEQIGQAFIANTPAEFDESVEALFKLLKQRTGELALSDKTVDLELAYYASPSLGYSWILMVVAMVVTIMASYFKKPVLDWVSIGLIILGFATLTYFLYMRGSVAGRLPAAGFFESLVLIGWGAALVGVVHKIFSSHRSLPLTAAGVAASALMLADLTPISRFITPIKPATLNSVWMASHVPTIIVSYAILGIAVGIAHYQVFVLALSKKPKETSDRIDTLLYWYLMTGSLLLLIGILTGAMWAVSNWGKYWFWDRKEVWSMVAFLAYMVILHVRLQHDKIKPYHVIGVGACYCLIVAVLIRQGIPATPTSLGIYAAIGVAGLYLLLGRGKMAMALKSILAFWTIIMTYMGVYYILETADLGKYDFGASASAKRVFLMGIADLVVLGTCAVVYHRRNRVTNESQK